MNSKLVKCTSAVMISIAVHSAILLAFAKSATNAPARSVAIVRLNTETLFSAALKVRTAKRIKSAKLVKAHLVKPTNVIRRVVVVKKKPITQNRVPMVARSVKAVTVPKVILEKQLVTAAARATRVKKVRIKSFVPSAINKAALPKRKFRNVAARLKIKRKLSIVKNVQPRLVTAAPLKSMQVPLQNPKVLRVQPVKIQAKLKRQSRAEIAPLPARTRIRQPKALTALVASKKIAVTTKIAALTPSVKRLSSVSPDSQIKQVSRETILANFVSSYNGGDCFYAVPIKLAGAVPQIVGFGASVPPFEKFLTTFRQKHGVIPQLGLRQVSRAQCPVVNFISAILKNRPPNLQILLESTSIEHGKHLQGTIFGISKDNITIFLIDDEGKVHNIGAFARSVSRGVLFEPQVFGTGDGKSRVQLIVAVATKEQLPQWIRFSTKSSQNVFARLLQYLNNTTVSAQIGMRAFVVK